MASRPIKSPNTRPLLPRMSSAMSGFFLLGHDAGAGGEGVVQLDEFILPGAPEHDLLAQAGEVHHGKGHGEGDLGAEVPVGDAVQAVLAHLGEAQELGGELAVQGVGGAGQGAAAQGHDIHALLGVVKTGEVPQEHLAVGHEVVAEGDGLGPLQVGVPGHDGPGVLLRFFAQHPHQVLQLGLEGGHVFPQGEAHVQGHLVVAAAGGMEGACPRRRCGR